MKPLFSVLAFMVISCGTQIQPESGFSSQNPNIVWLVSEDLSPYIPPFGDSTIETPNLSRLAAEGIRYTNVFSPSGVCAPSRFALATGMYPSGLGGNHMRTRGHHLEEIGLIEYEVVPPPEVKMMSQILRENGYYCSNNDKEDHQFAPPLGVWDESSPYAHWRNRSEGKPFFSIFNFAVTHESQFFGPPSKRNLRYNDNFPDTTRHHQWADRIDSSEWIMNVPPGLQVNIPPYLPENDIVRNDMRVMYSNIIEMDRQVGVLLRQLEEDGLLDKTIVVWYTDHGGPLPRQKRLMYDSGLKVPMIIRHPDRQRAGEIEDQLISFIDFAPTVFSMAGIEPPAYLHGRAFDGKFLSEPPRKYIHAAADRLDKQRDIIRAVRDSRFKYLRNFNPEQGYYLPIAYRERISTMQELLRLRDAGKLNEIQMQWFRELKPEEELFDTWNDPHEINNLAQDPKFAQKLEELRQECDSWMNKINDKGFIPESDLISSFWPDWEQPLTADPEIRSDGSSIEVVCPTIGASIIYQLTEESAEPKPMNWEIYVRPVPMPEGSTFHTRAHRIGFKPSGVVQN